MVKAFTFTVANLFMLDIKEHGENIKKYVSIMRGSYTIRAKEKHKANLPNALMLVTSKQSLLPFHTVGKTTFSTLCRVHGGEACRQLYSTPFCREKLPSLLYGGGGGEQVDSCLLHPGAQLSL